MSCSLIPTAVDGPPAAQATPTSDSQVWNAVAGGCRRARYTLRALAESAPVCRNVDGGRVHFLSVPQKLSIDALS